MRLRRSENHNRPLRIEAGKSPSSETSLAVVTARYKRVQGIQPLFVSLFARAWACKSFDGFPLAIDRYRYLLSAGPS